MSRTAFVRLMIGASVVLAGLVVALTVIDTEGDPADLPGALVSVAPRPNDMVFSQTRLEVVLPVGYEMTLTVDGITVPGDEISVTPEIGQFRWQPAPGRVVEFWAPGDHEVEITWDRVVGGPPDPGDYRWVFRVT